MDITAQQLYEKLKHVKIGGQICQFTLQKCECLAPIINEINRLKKEKNAVILVHSYVSAEIAYGVGDFIGDSYKLAKDALSTKADIIVFCAVKFMAETAKTLNPDKKVYIPNELNGCTLADSITATEVKNLRQQYPGYSFVCYVNTSAEVKAECDVCVTSSNCYDVIEAIPNDKIFFVPDKLMGQNIVEELKRRGAKKDIRLHHGTCYVHEEYNPELIEFVRKTYPGVKVVSHPECNAAIIAHSDYIGSTAQLLKHMKQSTDHQFLVLTECGLASRLQIEMPEKEIVGSCTLCKYMKSNNLSDILRVLKHPEPADEITLDEGVRVKALKTLEAMFRYTDNRPSANAVHPS